MGLLPQELPLFFVLEVKSVKILDIYALNAFIRVAKAWHISKRTATFATETNHSDNDTSLHLKAKAYRDSCMPLCPQQHTRSDTGTYDR